MKKIKTLILPMACIASSAAIVAPLLTSCGKTIADSDVTHGYTPKIDKHDKAELSAAQALSDYKTAIRKNPQIVVEDYKYWGAQLNSFLENLEIYSKKTKSYDSGSNSQDHTFEYYVKEFRAGLKDFYMDDNDRVSYSSGLAANFRFTYNYDETEYDEKTGKTVIIATHPIDIELNLSIEAFIKNFAGIDLKHSSSMFEKDLTLVKPVWPNNLLQEDWSFGLTVNGSLSLAYDKYTILNLPNIDINKTFDHSNYWWLEVNIGNLLEGSQFASSDMYLMDLCTFFGTFCSYYMSDVTCKQHFKVEGATKLTPILYSEKYPNWYTGTIVFKMDEERTNFDDIELVPLTDSSETQISALDGSDNFELTNYVDEQGVEHKDMCSVDILLVEPFRKETYKDELEFNICCYQPKGDSYKWTEKHGDKFYMEKQLSYISEEKFNEPVYTTGNVTGYDPEKGIIIEPNPINIDYSGCSFKFSTTLTEDAAKGSAFKIGVRYNDLTPSYWFAFPITLQSITVDGEAFTDYEFINNVITLGQEFKSGTTISITVKIGSVTEEYAREIDGIWPLLIPGK